MNKLPTLEPLFLVGSGRNSFCHAAADSNTGRILGGVARFVDSIFPITAFPITALLLGSKNTI